MILYVDETECDDYFIVAGLLTDSKMNTDRIYKIFKKRIKNIPLPPRKKEQIFTEFKSVLLDREYQRIKVKMIEHINMMNYSIFYSVYRKENKKMNQITKEEQYILLLENIVSKFDKGTDIIFDAFRKKDFEDRIIKTISIKENVCSIDKQDSRLEAGLQFIDNICSAIRLYETHKNEEFYNLLMNIKEV